MKFKKVWDARDHMNRVHDGQESLEVGHRKLVSLDNARFSNSNNGWARRMRFSGSKRRREVKPKFAADSESLVKR